jgi:hypothetical protein
MRDDVRQVGTQAFASCTLSHELLATFAERIERSTTPTATATESEEIRLSTLRGYFSRTYAWLSSIRKLNAPEDVQAIVVAARSLFEAVVDLTLVRHEPGVTLDQMFAWERSAKLKFSERVSRFFNGTAQPPYDSHVAFLGGAEPAQIRIARDRWWNGRHPDRWTGRSLETDTQRADARLPGAKLLAFYELEFAPSCWGTHGSALAAFRSTDLNLVPAATAIVLINVHRFSILIARLIAEELGIFSSAEFDEFERNVRARLPALEP